MANPNLLWVRDALHQDDDIASPQSFGVDLLWKARTGENVQGSDVAVARPAAAGDPRAFYPRPLAPQDISGALVKRVILRYQLSFAPMPSSTIDGTNVASWTTAGWYEGVKVTNAYISGYVNAPARAPGDAARSVTDDWMHWDRRYILDDMRTVTLVEGQIATLGHKIVMVSRDIDVKSQRRLKEWDDTIYFYLEPSDSRTIDNVAASWSVLLETP